MVRLRFGTHESDMVGIDSLRSTCRRMDVAADIQHAPVDDSYGTRPWFDVVGAHRCMVAPQPNETAPYYL